MLSAKVSSSWKKITEAFAKVSGNWKKVGQIYVKVSGSWKPIWKYSWTYSAYGNCSVNCGGGVQTRTATCTRTENNSGTTTTVADAYCNKFVKNKSELTLTKSGCNSNPCDVVLRLMGNCDDKISLYYKSRKGASWVTVTSGLGFKASSMNGRTLDFTATNVNSDNLIYIKFETWDTNGTSARCQFNFMNVSKSKKTNSSSIINTGKTGHGNGGPLIDHTYIWMTLNVSTMAVVIYKIYCNFNPGVYNDGSGGWESGGLDPSTVCNQTIFEAGRMVDNHLVVSTTNVSTASNYLSSQNTSDPSGW